MRRDHFPDDLFTLFFKIRAFHAVPIDSPGVVFFPHKYAKLIAHVKEELIVGIMGSADGVGAQVLYKL